MTPLIGSSVSRPVMAICSGDNQPVSGGGPSLVSQTVIGMLDSFFTTIEYERTEGPHPTTNNVKISKRGFMGQG